MAVDEGTLAKAEQVDVKGKAVFVLHTWKDALWEMGASKGLDVPEPRNVEPVHNEQTAQEQNGVEHVQGPVEQTATNGASLESETTAANDAATAEPSSPPLTPEGTFNDVYIHILTKE